MSTNSSADNKPGTSKSSTHPLDRYTVEPPRSYATGGGKEEDSPYYKSAAPSITLPKGGGALKGIDEKFTVNAVNGTAALEIAFPFSAGRNGFTPALGLSYNSGSGNSEFGLGWSMSLPSIQRKTDKKLPEYNDSIDSDVFILAGAEDLVPVLDDSGNKVQREVTIDEKSYLVRYYRPRIEGLYARIEYIILKNNGVGNRWWRVTTKDNISTWYGLTDEGRIADPQQAARIFKWLPQLVCDNKGNIQLYHYIKENEENIPVTVYEGSRLNGTAPCTNTYLRSVYYGNTEAVFIKHAGSNPYSGSVHWEPNTLEPDLAELEGLDYMFTTLWNYGEAINLETVPDDSNNPIGWPYRKDSFSDYRAGFEIRTRRKCYSVLQYHHFGEHYEGAVKQLQLVYALDSQESFAEAEADYITEALQHGHKKYPEDSTVYSSTLPAMTFTYQPLQWNTDIESVQPEDFDGAPQGLTGPYQWIDFWGEGISGILTEQAQGWYYKRNLGDGRFTPAMSIAQKPNFNGLGSSLQWQDLDADGRRQIVSSAPMSGYWELDDDQSWQGFSTFPKNLNIDWNSPYTKMLDLDGDGRADVLIADTHIWWWYKNEGKKGYDTGGGNPASRDEHKGPRLVLNDAVQSIFLADMSGDGLTDLVRIRNGEVCYWPNLGYGRFGAKVTMGNAPVFQQPDLFNPIYFTLADISGTGAADLIYTGRNYCLAWVNLSGNALSEPVHINPLPATDQYSKITVTDFLGNGTGCIVWSSPLPHFANAPLQYIDLMGGVKPHIMLSYSNGMGKTVSLEYKSSTKYYLEDNAQGTPWATRLPFPVQCVAGVTTTDNVSQTIYRQQYRYRHGYYDHEEREFRGFGYVETTDSDSALESEVAELDQPPVVTKTWYHTGAWPNMTTLLTVYKKEYYPGLLSNANMYITLPSNLNPQEYREALRALKGMPLMQEVYGRDGSIYEPYPYSQTAYSYIVRKIQKQGKNRHSSFQPHQKESIAMSCERGYDPENDTPTPTDIQTALEDARIMQELVLEIDDYGNVLQSAQVAYPRKSGFTVPDTRIATEQQKLHITYTCNDFTNSIGDDYAAQERINDYRLKVACESISYEVLPAIGTYTGVYFKASEVKAIYDSITGGNTHDFESGISPAAYPQKRKLSHQRQYFYKDDLTGASDFAVLQSLALPYESYQMAYTPGLIDEDYCSATQLAEGGYIEMPVSFEPEADIYYWVPSGVVTYLEAEHFYSPYIYKDPWDNATTISYDGNSAYLLVESTTDALGNVQEVTTYDYHCLQPLSIKDLNNNVTDVLYDALGLPVAMALKGKGSEADTLADIEPYDGDDIDEQQKVWQESDPADVATAARLLLKGATWRCIYDLSQKPAAVAMIGRTEHHTLMPYPEVLIRCTYTDGMGRIAMHKVSCEPTVIASEAKQPPACWIGSGRTVYNNKGNPVMQYEPYFSYTQTYNPAEQDTAMGEAVSPRMYYDALSRVYKTEMPDGSFSATKWTPWMQQVWDNNDTILQSQWYAARIGGGMGTEERAAAIKAEAHANTPDYSYFDTLARPFYNIRQRFSGADIEDHSESIHNYQQLDISSNLIRFFDGRGLEALQNRHNMLGATRGQKSKDSGMQRTILDVAEQPLYNWDADNRKFSSTYDELRRPLSKAVEVYDDIEEDWTDRKVLEVYEYGEGQTSDISLNLRGQLYRHYDGSGMQQVNEYDFKGNPLETERQLLDDPELAEVDWDSSPALNPEVFPVKVDYDALNRPILTTDPGNNIQTFEYNKTGLLKIVLLNSKSYIQDTHYDAKGQRKAIWYGNGTKTGYTYDPLTFRLRNQLTVNVDSGNVYYNEKMQDLSYWYDPVGNITEIQDDAQQTLYYANTVIDPTQLFTYDALYRLIEATGREQIAPGTFGVEDNYSDADWKAPLGSDAARSYTQYYKYDAAGNILMLKHVAGAGSYTRYYDIDTDSNKMLSTANYIPDDEEEILDETYNYSHDGRGNIDQMPHLSDMVWNAENVLSSIINSSIPTYYQYSNGERVRKYTDKGGIKEERIYLGNFELYRKYVSGVLSVERQTVHVSDDTGRIAMLETLTVGSDGSLAELERYIYSNHLQSATLELDDTGEIISYEEYHPYGTTAYQAMNSSIAAVAKRYRYTGKERDEETGLYYHGARYYIPWLCRWTAVDPLETEYAGISPYCYSFNNPVIFNDPSGQAPEGKTVTNPVGKEEHIQEGMSSSIGGQFIYNNPDAAEKNWDYAMWNDEAGEYEFHSYGFNDENEVNGANATQKEAGVLEKIWGNFTVSNPIEAGILNGTWNFVSGTVEGIYNTVRHPINTFEGIGSFLYANATTLSGIPLTPEALEYQNALNLKADEIINTVKSANLYQISSMATEVSLNIGFAVKGTNVNPFGLRGGYGVFGEKGLKLGNYRIDVLYANPLAGQRAGTIFSLKQMKSGGALWRWDYGAIHETNQLGLHSTVRFYWNGTKYGSTAQRTWYPSTLKAPFFKALK